MNGLSHENEKDSFSIFTFPLRNPLNDNRRKNALLLGLGVVVSLCSVTFVVSSSRLDTVPLLGL